MQTISGITIRPAQLSDSKDLANLIHFEIYVHRHLDWHSPLDWIGQNPFLVIEDNKRIIAALACPVDEPTVAWIRMFATTNKFEPDFAWKTLWNEAYSWLEKEQSIKIVAAIPLHEWFKKLLVHNNFQIFQKVIMLRWENSVLPECKTSNVTIRQMTMEDISSVKSIDDEAFTPVWRNSLSALKLAFQQATYATIAEYNGEIIGYQISTLTQLGGHLARLAVLPHAQKRGIGFALLSDFLEAYRSKGTKIITVNTQNDNLASLALYKKAGFVRTGEEYPFCQISIDI